MSVSGLPEDELDQIKELLKSRTEGDEQSGDFSYDDIINEFRYNSATTPRAQREAEEEEARAILEDWERAPARPAEPENRGDAKPYAVPRADRPKKGRAHPGEPDDDTKHLIELAKKMREFVREEEPSAGNEDKDALREPAEMELSEVVLGSAESFDQYFRPSEQFAGDEDDGEAAAEGRATKGPSLLSKFVAYLKKPSVAEELTPEQHLARVAPYVRSLRVRTAAALVLFGILALITGLQTSSVLPQFLSGTERPYSALLAMSVLMILCMLCGVDVLAKGLSDIVHLRPGAETLALFSCLCTLLHVAVVVAATGKDAISVGNTPYCAVSAGTVFFALWGQAHRYGGFMRACKVAVAAGETPDAVLCEDNLWDTQHGFIRRSMSAPDFLSDAQKPDIVGRVTRFIAPLLIICCFLFAGLAAAAHPRDDNYPKVTFFYWALSAIACAAAPMSTFCAYPFVLSRISRRLSHMGASIAGWHGASEMNRGAFAVLGDLDLFPAGTIALNGLKAIGTHSFDRITSYSSSLLAASGSGLYRAFEQLTREQKNTLRHVSNFETYEGGVSGDIDGCGVLLGTLNFMHRMGIQMPREQSIKNAVYLTVNHDLAGIFAVSYIPSTQTEGALVLMERQKIGSVLAVRDFNITPTMLKGKYGIDPDAVEFPVVEDRLSLSSSEKTLRSRPAALLTREGLCPYAEAVAGGQKLYRFTMINLMIHLLSLVGGMLLAFYFTRATAPGASASISPFNMLLYMGIWWALTWVVALFSHRY